MDEKRRLERGAFDAFASHFNERANRDILSFVEHLSPPHPDLKCRLGAGNIYIEVAHAFGTEVDARKILRHGTKNQPNKREDQRNVIVKNMENRIIEPLNATIYEHCLKDYLGVPCWLLIRIGNFLYDLSEYESYKNRIVIPAHNSFQEIWLLCGPRKESGAVQLWSSA